MTNRAYAKSNGDGLLCSILCRRNAFSTIEIINNTRGGIVILIQLKKGNAEMGGKFKSRMCIRVLIGDEFQISQ